MSSAAFWHKQFNNTTYDFSDSFTPFLFNRYTKNDSDQAEFLKKNKEHGKVFLSVYIAC